MVRSLEFQDDEEKLRAAATGNVGGEDGVYMGRRERMCGVEAKRNEMKRG